MAGKLEQWLIDKAASSRLCPVCGGSDWAEPDKRWELSEYARGAIVAGGLKYCVMVAECKNCHHIQLFNSTKI